MTATVTDLFCGAGGSSLGAENAGARLVLGANHWPKAIETHQANFPDAGHDCADISQVDPRRYQRTDILLASPECTNHSSAKGISRKAQDPSLFDSPDLSAERSRATMWDVHRFVEHHRYDAVIVENVVDAARWVYWPSWRAAWDDAGYDTTVVSWNSAHTGSVPQWRDRIYVVATRKGVRPDLELRPESWCLRCEAVVSGRQAWKNPTKKIGKWRQQYDWRCPACLEVVAPPAPPSASIIDWDLPGTRIGDRKRPLAENTLNRIRRALDRYGPSLVAAAGNTYERPGSGYLRAWPLNSSAPTQTTTGQHALIVPLHHGATGPPARTTHTPHPTQTTRQEHALVIPMRTNGRGRPTTDPTPTVTAGNGGGGMHLVFAPQSGGKGRPTNNPAPSVATKAAGFLVGYTSTGRAEPLTDPASTVTTRDRHGLVDQVALDIDDCTFRMLEPHEAGRAMAFPDSYLVEGTKKDRMRLYGGAVTPPVMQLLVDRVTAALKAAA